MSANTTPLSMTPLWRAAYLICAASSTTTPEPGEPDATEAPRAGQASSTTREIRLCLDIDTASPGWLAFLDALGVYFAEQYLKGVMPKDSV